jgi:23S rRNA pseudouridine1911/1915/1917 synthase
MSKQSQEHQVQPAEAGRVDRVVQALTGRSRSQVRGLIDHGCVTVNATACTSDFQPVREGDRVVVTWDPQRRYAEKPKPRSGAPFYVVFEDDSLLVVDKAAHLLTVPTPKRETDTLVHLLQAYVSRGRKGLRRVEVVHRLDREASGLLVFAKDRHTAERLREQFAATKPERDYLAIVAGSLATDQGTFDKWLVTDRETIHRRCAPRPGVGESAVTHYQVTRRLPDATVVRVRLETGRRNQIRVHFADAGHPVLGDPRYGPPKRHHRLWPRARLALHAAALAFTHPVTGKRLRFESRLPAEFRPFTD